MSADRPVPGSGSGASRSPTSGHPQHPSPASTSSFCRSASSTGLSAAVWWPPSISTTRPMSSQASVAGRSADCGRRRAPPGGWAPAARAFGTATRSRAPPSECAPSQTSVDDAARCSALTPLPAPRRPGRRQVRGPHQPLLDHEAQQQRGLPVARRPASGVAARRLPGGSGESHVRARARHNSPPNHRIAPSTCRCRLAWGSSRRSGRARYPGEPAATSAAAPSRAAPAPAYQTARQRCGHRGQDRPPHRDRGRPAGAIGPPPPRTRSAAHRPWSGLPGGRRRHVPELRRR